MEQEGGKGVRGRGGGKRTSFHTGISFTYLVKGKGKEEYCIALF